MTWAPWQASTLSVGHLNSPLQLGWHRPWLAHTSFTEHRQLQASCLGVTWVSEMSEIVNEPHEKWATQEVSHTRGLYFCRGGSLGAGRKWEQREPDRKMHRAEAEKERIGEQREGVGREGERKGGEGTGGKVNGGEGISRWQTVADTTTNLLTSFLHYIRGEEL